MYERNGGITYSRVVQIKIYERRSDMRHLSVDIVLYSVLKGVLNGDRYSEYAILFYDTKIHYK